MQISSTPTAYGGGEAHRLLNLLLHRQGAPPGQELPGADQTSTATTTPQAQPASGPNVAAFAADTLSSLLSAQEAPPSSSDVAAKVIGAVDTNGDGALSLDEVETALGQDTTSGADALGQAFSKLDTNGDGSIDAGELTSALDARKSASGVRHAHHAHAAAPSSSDLASKVLGAFDSDGDGGLSAAEIQSALGSSTGGSLASSVGKLDADANGKLSASELSAAIDAFRSANHRGGTSTATAQSASAVTA